MSRALCASPHFSQICHDQDRNGNLWCRTSNPAYRVECVTDALSFREASSETLKYVTNVRAYTRKSQNLRRILNSTRYNPRRIKSRVRFISCRLSRGSSQISAERISLWSLAEIQEREARIARTASASAAQLNRVVLWCASYLFLI